MNEGTEETVIGVALEELGEQTEVNSLEELINMDEEM